MSKRKMNLQQFADRHGLLVKKNASSHCICGDAIKGPNGEIWEAYAGLFYFQWCTGYHKLNPVTQVKRAIEAIGLQYTDKFLIVRKTDGWYVANKAGPFKTREDARTARESLKSNQQETPKKIT